MPAACAKGKRVSPKGDAVVSLPIGGIAPDLASQFKWLHEDSRRGLRAIDIIRRVKPETRQIFSDMPHFIRWLKAVCANNASELDWVDVVVCGRVNTIVFSVKE